MKHKKEFKTIGLLKHNHIIVSNVFQNMIISKNISFYCFTDKIKNFEHRIRFGKSNSNTNSNTNIVLLLFAKQIPRKFINSDNKYLLKYNSNAITTRSLYNNWLKFCAKRVTTKSKNAMRAQVYYKWTEEISDPWIPEPNGNTDQKSSKTKIICK